eukprot:TRINITY_DN8957_c0_g1_i1.p1 TRINITY_DN8957_c0_g1~~TRINITY_DN8957_c0_g1_i1.p1  ORF type:complete len:317 (+),score=50.71 TRINITY_DN8957_c0_g1_i1:86-1036(+)
MLQRRRGLRTIALAAFAGGLTLMFSGRNDSTSSPQEAFVNGYLPSPEGRVPNVARGAKDRVWVKTPAMTKTRQLSNDQLHELIAEQKQKMFQWNQDKKIRRLNPMGYLKRYPKKYLAQMKTILRERELADMPRGNFQVPEPPEAFKTKYFNWTQYGQAAEYFEPMNETFAETIARTFNSESAEQEFARHARSRPRVGKFDENSPRWVKWKRREAVDGFFMPNTLHSWEPKGRKFRMPRQAAFKTWSKTPEWKKMMHKAKANGTYIPMWLAKNRTGVVVQKKPKWGTPGRPPRRPVGGTQEAEEDDGVQDAEVVDEE